MNCPSCGAGITDGEIVGRAPGVKFKKSKGMLADLAGIPLTSGFFNHSAPASRCESCGTVVVPGRRSRG